MEIVFDNRRLEKVCMQTREAVKELGSDDARKLQQRIGELRAAETLEDFCRLPGPRCHELTKNRAGQFAADLKHSRRLVMIPEGHPVPCKPDGGIDRALVRSIRILGVVDYHGD